MNKEKACAKVNLTLDVLGRRADGYHDLCMVMETVDLCDHLRFTQGGEGVSVRSNLRFLPTGDNNLAAAAALAFGKATGVDLGGLIIEIEKHIPVCAGTAGGSSDAAAVLRYLNRKTGADLSDQALRDIAAQVGSDVPYCLRGGTALAEGRGEKLTALPPLPGCWFVLCKPPFSISTPALFAQVDRHKLRRRPDTKGVLAALEAGDLAGVARRLYNVFEDVLDPRQARAVAEIKNRLINAGALGTVMTGTGSTVYGLFDREAAAQGAWEELKESYDDVFLCHNV